MGSSFELEAQILIAKAVEFGNKELILLLLKEIDEEQKMLMSYLNKIKE